MNEQELIEKYGLDIETLKKEQIKLYKNIILKDAIDFSSASRFGAIENILVGNQIISAVIVCDKEFNILEQQYALDKLRFPYLSEFRSYRELPSMLEAFNKLTEKPDIMFIKGHGITHPRLGLASHFALMTNIPTIGITENIFECNKIEGENILKDKKKTGRILQTKEKANPLYLSPGSNISIISAYNLVKETVTPPHKLPQPLHLVHKYAKQVKDELKL
jgi:deoxyribonuclease V